MVTHWRPGSLGCFLKLNTMNPLIYTGLPSRIQKMAFQTFKPLDLNLLLNNVSLCSNVSMKDILSKSRKKHIILARMMFVGIALEHPKPPTLLGIGKLIEQHHSTVIHTRETYKDMYFSDKNFRMLTEEIKTKFYGTARN